MKILLFILVLVFVSIGVGQTVVITPKMTTYTRPKPITDYKNTFTVRYPKVKAATPALSRKIEKTVSYADVLKLNIQEEIRDIQWLEEADFEVGYNKNGLLSITLSMNGSGAYPDGTSKTIVVDLKTGNRMRPIDVFTNLNGLVDILREDQRLEVEQAIAEIKKDPEAADLDTNELFQNVDFKMSHLDEFAVSDTGVTFIYDYNFPHVIQALEPSGRYTLTWAELKPFIKRGGLLARFAR